MTSLIILNNAPYGTEHDFNGLRLAMALQKNSPDKPVIVFLMADAVLCAKKGQKTPDGYYNIERMLRRIILSKGQVKACGVCLTARGLDIDQLLDGVEKGTMDGLAADTIEAEKVLVF